LSITQKPPNVKRQAMAKLLSLTVLIIASGDSHLVRDAEYQSNG